MVTNFPPRQINGKLIEKMFYSEQTDSELYEELMEQIKKVNMDWLELRKSREYRIGLVVCELFNDMKELQFRKAFKAIQRWISGKRGEKVKSSQHMTPTEMDDKEVVALRYFAKDKIAVYSAVFGNYDTVLEPYMTPDNCDFYLFADQSIDDRNSVWQRRICPDEIKDLPCAEQNRYLKMHPHLLFPEYRYSIYVDGNVQIVTDLTEYVNQLNEYGLATHIHNNRSCVYDELEAVLKSGKETKANVDKHKEYLIETGMPHNYGLLQCSVIVREHHNPQCISIMEDWWEEYLVYSKRDQVSLPHILYMHGIQIGEIGVLGRDLYKNPSFRIGIHK